MVTTPMANGFCAECSVNTENPVGKSIKYARVNKDLTSINLRNGAVQQWGSDPTFIAEATTLFAHVTVSHCCRASCCLTVRITTKNLRTELPLQTRVSTARPQKQIQKSLLAPPVRHKNKNHAEPEYNDN